MRNPDALHFPPFRNPAEFIFNGVMRERLDRAVVILGSPNDHEGNISPMGIGRIALGHSIYRDNSGEGCRILLTGGFGDHFNTTERPHAWYAWRRLMKMGVPEGHILEFAESRHTVEDALLSRDILDRYEFRDIVIVTSDFHLKRVKYIFNEIFAGRDWEVRYEGASWLPEIPEPERRRLMDHETAALERLRRDGIVYE